MAGHLSEMCFLSSSLQLFSRVSSISLCCYFSLCDSLRPASMSPLVCWCAQLSWGRFPRLAPLLAVLEKACPAHGMQVALLSGGGERTWRGWRVRRPSSQCCDNLSCSEGQFPPPFCPVRAPPPPPQLNTEEKCWCRLHKLSQWERIRHTEFPVSAKRKVVNLISYRLSEELFCKYRHSNGPLSVGFLSPDNSKL